MHRLLPFAIVFLLAACVTAGPPLGAGFRFSTYGAPQGRAPEYWLSVGERMAGNFDAAVPQTIWIVGSLFGNGTYLNFPCETDLPDITCGYADMNEANLYSFDASGMQVWLQVEAGNADMLELIDLVLERYGQHPSVIGFGVDVEWYQSPQGALGVPVTDELAHAWVQAVRRHNPDYRLFLKHWDSAWMPPTYREGIVFINDSQQFEDLEALLADFTAWGVHFAPAPVGYQFGYPADRPWWNGLDNPPAAIGQAILAAVPNTESLFWVDFTIDQVFPELP
jgi:hypothetical protein